MYKHTKQYLIDNVASHWRQTYEGNPSKMKVWEKLVKLENPTEEQISAIIGNASWTRLQCDCCKTEVDEVVVLVVTGERYSTYLCPTCLQKALDLVKAPEITN